jgi:cytochrome P450
MNQASRLGVGIIGAGRVGPVIGAALAGAGHALTGITASSDPDRVEAILPGVPVLAADEVARRSELVVVAVPHAERGPLRDWSLAILSALEPAPSAAVLAHANAAVQAFLPWLGDLIERRRRAPGDPDVDVLTRLMQGDAQGTLSERELMHNCIFLLNAGHETTTNLIGNGIDTLLAHRGELQRLVEQPALINPAVEELLRWESPVQLNNRRTTAPVAISDRELPAGCFVTLAIGAANRDPAEFDQPERLDIARRPSGKGPTPVRA